MILFAFLLHLFCIKWDFSVTGCPLALLAEGYGELLPCGHLTHVRLLDMFSGVLKDSVRHACPILAAGVRSLGITSGGGQGWQWPWSWQCDGKWQTHHSGIWATKA